MRGAEPFVERPATFEDLVDHHGPSAVHQREQNVVQGDQSNPGVVLAQPPDSGEQHPERLLRLALGERDRAGADQNFAGEVPLAQLFVDPIRLAESVEGVLEEALRPIERRRDVVEPGPQPARAGAGLQTVEGLVQRGLGAVEIVLGAAQVAHFGHARLLIGKEPGGVGPGGDLPDRHHGEEGKILRLGEVFAAPGVGVLQQDLAQGPEVERSGEGNGKAVESDGRQAGGRPGDREIVSVLAESGGGGAP